MGIDENGAEERQLTRGTNRVTEVEHGLKLGPMGIRREENILGNMVNRCLNWGGQLYEPMELKTLICACKGLWE